MLTVVLVVAVAVFAGTLWSQGLPKPGDSALTGEDVMSLAYGPVPWYRYAALAAYSLVVGLVVALGVAALIAFPLLRVLGLLALVYAYFRFRTGVRLRDLVGARS